MGDDDKKPKPFGMWKDEPQPNNEQSVKVGHEAAREERGVGNRKPEGPPAAKNAVEFSVGPVFKLETRAEGALYDSSKEKGADQKSFYKLYQGKVGDVELLSSSINLTEGKAKVTIAKGKAEGSVAHGELDIVDTIKKWFFGDKPEPPKPPSIPRVMPAPGAARVSDFVAHGGALFPGIGSQNVFIDGLPAWRCGVDSMLCTAPGPPHGAGMAFPTQTNVLINGFPAARAGDVIVEATGGANMIIVGSQTVFIGMPAPAPPELAAPAPPEAPSVTLEAVLKADFLAGEAALDAYGEVDLASGKVVVEGQAGAMVALLKGELPFKVKIPIPGTEYSIGLGLTLEGTLISAGAEAGGGIVINNGKKLFDFTWGAKAGVGLGGAGVKFGFDINKNK